MVAAELQGAVMSRLPDGDARALREALEQVYRSSAIHDRILRDFRAPDPLQGIRNVEAMHIRLLECLHARYGLPTPSNRWRGRVPRFDSLVDACAAAIDVGTEHAYACERLIAGARDAEILAALRNLERAVREAHLPALHAWSRELSRRKGSLRRQSVTTRKPREVAQDS